MLRIDGEICPLNQTPLQSSAIEQCLRPMLPHDKCPLDDAVSGLDFAFEIPALARFRAHVFQHSRGLGAAFRIVPTIVPTMQDLGMGEVFHGIAMATRGLVLITGPAGAGKSSTLAALIHHINTHQKRHILTIEDPIEFIHHSHQCLLNQREIPNHVSSIYPLLRSALRADPDVMMIGELRDLQTIRLAINAAETGHLVLSTLHTLSAAKTIDRLVGSFPNTEQGMVRNMLAESLHAVIAQKLVKKTTGGRIAAREIMLNNPSISHLIRANKLAQITSVIQTNRAVGMQTMEQCLTDLADKGLVA